MDNKLFGCVPPKVEVNTSITPPVKIIAELTSTPCIEVKLDSSGPKGDNYILTEEDKDEIAAIVLDKYVQSIPSAKIQSLFPEKEVENNG